MRKSVRTPVPRTLGPLTTLFWALSQKMLRAHLARLGAGHRRHALARNARRLAAAALLFCAGQALAGELQTRGTLYKENRPAEPNSPLRREDDLFRPEDVDLGPHARALLRPGYIAIEGVTDGVFEVLRTEVIDNLLPGRLTRNLRPSPDSDSYAAFERNLREKELRYVRRLENTYPIHDPSSLDSHEKMQEWQSWAGDEQLGAVIDAFEDTLVERHQLELFGDRSGDYALDRRNWDPGFLTMAGLLGGTFLYLNGAHTDLDAGALRFGFDMAPGIKIRHAVSNQQGISRVATFELGLKSLPVSLLSEWGFAHGTLMAKNFGAKGSWRF